jgi:hypothetical protein
MTASKDYRLVWAGLLAAVIFLAAGLFVYRPQEQQEREIEAL